MFVYTVLEVIDVSAMLLLFQIVLFDIEIRNRNKKQILDGALG